MRTVSLEMAKKLKEAGLQWEPTEGDVFVALGGQDDILAYTITPPRVIYMDKERNLWLPTLSDLLEWLEGRGFRWCIDNIGEFSEDEGDVCIGLFDWDTRKYIQGRFYAETPEDAAAKAVLWVLEQEAVHMGRR